MGHLTDKQDEILGLLEEECAEVIQAIKKADRFGLSSEYQGQTNLQSIQREIGDVVALVFVISKMHPEILTDKVLEDAVRKKLLKLKRRCDQLKDLNVDDLFGE